MPTTFTIKQIPDAIADALRRRAAMNRRSLQRELLLVIEEAATSFPAAVHEMGEPSRTYAVSATGSTQARRKGAVKTVAAASGRLTLEQLWTRARALGASSPSESAVIVRRDRDARHGH